LTEGLAQLVKVAPFTLVVALISGGRVTGCMFQGSHRTEWGAPESSKDGLRQEGVGNNVNKYLKQDTPMG